MAVTYCTRAKRKAMSVFMGGSLFALSGCDPEVRATLLDGLQSTTTGLTTALITAYFQSLEEDETSDGLTTT